ncbi:MAG: hypothetical protein WCP35_03025 [Verrucomicrobiota bacterium]
MPHDKLFASSPACLLSTFRINMNLHSSSNMKTPPANNANRSAIRALWSRARSLMREVKHVWEVLRRSILESRLISRRVKNTKLSGPPVEGTVVFNAVRTFPTSDLELYLAHLCAWKGMTVYVLFDDGVLEHWDSNQIHAQKYASPYRAQWFTRWAAEIRRRLVCRAYRTGDLRTLKYSEMVRRCAVDDEPVDSDLGFAASSTKRFYETGSSDIDGEHKSYYQSCLRNCAVSRAIARYVVEVIKPDLFVTSHGIYSVWGPAFTAVREAGIPALVPNHDSTSMGGFRVVDEIQQRMSVCSDWRDFQRGLRNDNEAAMEGAKVLENRFSYQIADVQEYYPDGPERQSKFLENLPDGKVIFGMFPNVVWDGDVPERNIILDNVLEWCASTIETIRATPHHLCIRFHPSEATRMKGSMRLQDLLREKIPDLAEINNLTLIPSSEPIDTYWFAAKYIDVGLIYDGTLSLEMTYMGIPVVACTNGLFTLDEVVFKPKTLDDYRNFLRNPDSIMREFSQDGALRKKKAAEYFHWLFNESVFKFTPMVSHHNIRMDYAIVEPDAALSPDQQRVWDRLNSAMRKEVR